MSAHCCLCKMHQQTRLVDSMTDVLVVVVVVVVAVDATSRDARVASAPVRALSFIVAPRTMMMMTICRRGHDCHDGQLSVRVTCTKIFLSRSLVKQPKPRNSFLSRYISHVPCCRVTKQLVHKVARAVSFICMQAACTRATTLLLP